MLDPENPKMHLQYGAALNKVSNRQALSILQKAVALDPGSPAPLTELGIAVGRAGKQEEAAMAFHQSRDKSFRQRAQSQGKLETNQGIALLKAGKVQAAVEVLQKARNDGPSLPNPQKYLVIALAAQGRYSDANQAFEAAPSVSPKDPETHYNYGVALPRRRQWASSASQLQPTTALAAAHVRAHCAL